MRMLLALGFLLLGGASAEAQARPRVIDVPRDTAASPDSAARQRDSVRAAADSTKPKKTTAKPRAKAEDGITVPRDLGPSVGIKLLPPPVRRP